MSGNYRSNPSIFLLPDEKIILRTNPHWLFLAIPLVGIFLTFLFYFLFGCPFLGIIYQGLVHACYLISLLILFFVSIVFYLDWKFNRLYLTSLRLIKERGIIGKRFMAIKLKDIEDVTCKYGIWGRIFGFGSLTIESAGTFGKMDFEGMPRPRTLRWMIERQIFYANLKEPKKST
jgi:uncharacterized membrane protein YdbT with pleckstrin-like domain